MLVDLQHFNSVKVKVYGAGAEPYAEIGAGCQIKRALRELYSNGQYTLPSLGLITEQTIAGAISTGTHGSGRHCLSHYPLAARIVQFDAATGEPIIRLIEAGAELEAALCSLGGLGIVTAARMPIRKQYHIEGHFRKYDRLVWFDG